MRHHIEFQIKPPGKLARINWIELWRFRDLFLVMAWRDFSVRYKQTALGAIWAIFQPLISMMIFTFIFNRVAKVESGDGTPYPIFLFTGLILWQYFSGTLSKASETMVANQGMVQKVYFPRLILPTSPAITGFVDLGISSIVLLSMMIFYKTLPTVQSLLVLPLLILMLLLCALGGGLFLSALNVKYRDVRHALPFLIQIGMYFTPVVYPVQSLGQYPVAKQAMLWLNPISGIITTTRVSLLGHGVFDWRMIGISLFMSILYFQLGLIYFRSTERYFSDII